MPDAITDEGPEELLARLLALAQMKKTGGTGTCGQPSDYCFQLFAPEMTVAETGNAAVDAALRSLRDNLMLAWQQGSAAVAVAADRGLPGSDWEVEWTFDGDAIQLLCVRPS